jgi:peptide deformylase
MSVRETLQIGHPKLKAPNEPVIDTNNTHVKQVIQNLIDTMREKQLIGMAAPQIGENITAFVTEPRETLTRPADQSDELRIYINPKIVALSSEENIIFEGCGSVLHGQLFAPVSRPREVTIEALDRDGKSFRFIADGILGRVIQHEYDHLQGIEFLEKISDYRQVMTADFYRERVKDSDENRTASLITKKEFISL